MRAFARLYSRIDSTTSTNAKVAAMTAYFRTKWPRAVLGGTLAIGAYGIALWAMTRAPIALVAVLRETSVIFAALIGAWLLKEGHIARRIAGAATVAAGVVALKI